ncbi:MAG: hypothetical protein ACXV7D_10290 [Thermoanaerobaculia bacterium]
MKPEFPLRLIFDDGDCVVIDSPEELIEQISSIEAGDDTSHVWIRDALDRTVRLQMRDGSVLSFAIDPDQR